MIPRIALDAMSGDFGASVVVPAAVRVLAEHDSVELILVGDQATLSQMLGSLAPDMQRRLFIRHASQVVAMDEAPSNALRNKKDSSMRVAINLVKENTADACVSAGNTGALMATARYVLKTLPCIDRPAIISALPNMINGHTYMLDLGANVDVTPRHLLEFAIMGNVLANANDNLPTPRVGLLNIGEEEIKGNECVKEASKLLATCPINYIGFVEGNDIFKGTVDVVVCDGFTGNVSLKTTEGVAKMISHYVKQSFTQTWFSKLAALIALPILKDLRHKIDPRRYNGASLLGLKGIVIKSHGGADELAFAYAIKEAINEVEKNVPRRIADQVAAYLTEQRQVE